MKILADFQFMEKTTYIGKSKSIRSAGRINIKILSLSEGSNLIKEKPI